MFNNNQQFPNFQQNFSNQFNNNMQPQNMNQMNMMNQNQMGMGMNQNQMNMMNNQMNMMNQNQMNMMNQNQMNMMNMNMGVNPMGMIANMLSMQNMANNMPNNMANMANMVMNQSQNNNNNDCFPQNNSNQNNSNGFTVTFKKTQEGTEFNITIQCQYTDKVSKIIEQYRLKTGDNDMTERFVFNTKNLCPELTAAEQGLINGAEIKVIVVGDMKGAFNF